MYQLIIGVLVVVLIYLWFSGTNFWSARDIKGPTPLPFFGNLFSVISGTKHYAEVYEEIYNAYPDASYVGIYKMSSPTVLVRDLDLVKDILHTHFPSFSQNDFNVDEKVDPLFSKDPFAALPDQWKRHRNQISPVFTLLKMKRMTPLINDIATKLVKYVETNFASSARNGILEMDVKTLCSFYTIDVVSATAFGVNSQMFINPNSDFYKNATSVFGNSFMNSIKNFLIILFPRLNVFLQVPFVSLKVDIWLREIIREVLDSRKDDVTKPNDFLQAILDLNSANGLTEDEIVGYCLTLLVEGYETSSTLMSFCLYQMALNPEVQERGYAEIAVAVAENEGQLSGDVVEKMDLLENIMLETLRFHPPVLTLNKVCTGEFTLPPQFKDSQDSPRVTIPPGTPIVIPSNAIHLDPSVYPNPKEFDPDRHTPENKRDRDKFAYLAFSGGPRMCFGMKFALLQSKFGIASILLNYQLRLSKRTPQPLEISKNAFLLSPKGGLWLEFTKR